MLLIVFDETDVAAAFDITSSDFFQVLGSHFQSHIFFHVMFRNVIAAHRSQYEIAVIDDQFGPAFNENAKRMRVKGDQREQPMHENDDHAAAEGGKERRASIDCAGQDGREDDHQNRVESGLARERPFMSETDHDQGREKNDQTSQ